MNPKKEKTNYEAPQLTVVTCRVELGQTRSTGALGFTFEYGDELIESRSNTGGNWGNGDDNTWF